MKKITIIKPVRSLHQNQHAEAIGRGFGNIGVKTLITSNPNNITTKHVAIWGWRLGKELREKGYEVLVMERGYIGDRFKYTSLGWNGLNGHASFPEYPDDGGERFKKQGGIIKPWNKSGDYALILGQVKNDASLQGRDIASWYQNVAEKIKKIDIPVFFRPHPEAQRRGGYLSVDGIANLNGTLEKDMERAKFTVAYNSNSCVDSILNGIPCYAGDPGTMAYDLCMDSLYECYYPKREEKLYQIAWTQWTLNEIATGKPLEKLCEHLL